MNDVDEKAAELFVIAARVARKLADEYPAVEYDDIAQHLRLHAWENRTSIRLFHECDIPSNPVGLFYKEGSRFCSREVLNSADSVSNQEYTTSDVRKMLNDCLMIQGVINTYVPMTSRSYRTKHSRRPEQYSLDDWDSIIVGTEVKDHVRYLKEEDRVILFRRFVLDDDETYTNNALAKRVSRAIDRLTYKLNTFARHKSEWDDKHTSGYPGARRVLSRGASRAVSSDGGSRA